MKTTKNNSAEHCAQDALFITEKDLHKIDSRWSTPLFLYDEKGLRENAKSLFDLFSDVSGFCGYFPVSACPVWQILAILGSCGVGAYCETPEELQLALDAGICGKNIIYASMVLPPDMAELIREVDAVLLVANRNVLKGPLPRRVDLACSIPQKKEGKTIMNSGYRREHLGLTRSEIYDAVPNLTEAGIRVGLAMIEGANVTDEKFLAAKMQSILRLADDIEALTGIKICRIHPGEGPGYNYKKLNPAMDLALCARLASEAVAERDLTVEINFKRILVEQQAIFLTTVLDVIGNLRPGIVVDASATMMRTGKADRYRYACVMGKTEIGHRVVCDVLGSRASTSDWIGKKRVLPKTEAGDVLAFHDVGCSVAPGAEKLCFLRQEDGEIVRLEHCEE